eukprot:6193493-Pleurochrysis_carterae.AAC.2
MTSRSSCSAAMLYSKYGIASYSQPDLAGADMTGTLSIQHPDCVTARASCTALERESSSLHRG